MTLTPPPPLARASSYPTRSKAERHEVRLTGLTGNVSTQSITAFFQDEGITVLEVSVHHPTNSAPWASLFVDSEEAVARCVDLGQEKALMDAQIQVSRPSPPSPPPAPPHVLSTSFYPHVTAKSPSSLAYGYSESPPSFPRNRKRNVSLRGQFVPADHVPHHLWRNLYIVGLPSYWTQDDPSSNTRLALPFADYGVVQHSEVLGEPEKSGLHRIRGFILMSSHEEANHAMRALHATYFEGHRIDVSWSLKQYVDDDTQFRMPPYRGQLFSPPSTSVQSCAVLVENLALEPNMPSLRAWFTKFFGSISNLRIIATAQGTISVWVQFASPGQAEGLLNADHCLINGRTIRVTAYPQAGVPQPAPVPPRFSSTNRFDPFREDYHSLLSSTTSALSGISFGRTNFTPPSSMPRDSPPKVNEKVMVPPPVNRAIPILPPPVSSSQSKSSSPARESTASERSRTPSGSGFETGDSGAKSTSTKITTDGDKVEVAKPITQKTFEDHGYVGMDLPKNKFITANRWSSSRWCELLFPESASNGEEPPTDKVTTRHAHNSPAVL